MPELVGAKFELQAVVVRHAGICAIPKDAFVAINAANGLRYCCLAGGAWRFTGRNEIWERRGKASDIGICVDGLIESGAMIADVPRLKDNSATDFTLDSQGPLVGLLRFKVRWNTGFIENTRVEYAGS